MSDPPDTPALENEPSRADMVEGGSLLVVVAALLVPTLAGVNPLPGWDADPLTASYVPTQLSPFATSLAGVVTIAAACVLLLASAWRGTVRPILALLTLLATVATLAPGLVLFSGDAEQVRLSIAWAGAFAGAGAIGSTLRRTSPWLPVVAGLIIAAPLLIAAKGALQITFENRMTIASFEETRDAFYAARGWRPDSPQALQYERRLRQPDPTGWFGLANVFATFAAASAVGLAGWAVEAVTARGRGKPPLNAWATSAIAAAAIGMATMTVLSNAKGAIGAAIAGAGAVLAIAIVRRVRPKLAAATVAAVSIVAVVVPLAAIAWRGGVGTASEELSLLFRAFYVEGAIDVARANLPWGVGPGGFKDAWLLAKPDLSPDDITSPHSIIFDHVATLGFLSAPTLGMLAWLGFRPRTASGLPESRSIESKGAFIAIALTLAVPTLIGAQTEAAAATLEAAITRLASIGLAASVAWAVARSLITGALSLTPLVGAGVVALAHAQLDMTFSNPQAVGLAMLLLAAASIPGDTRPGAERPGPVANRATGLVAAGLVSLCAIAVGFTALPKLAVFSTTLRETAVESSALGERVRAFRERIMTGDATPEEDRELNEASIALSQRVGAEIAEVAAIFPKDVRLARIAVEQHLRAYEALVFLERRNLDVTSIEDPESYFDDASIEALTAIEYANAAVDAVPESTAAWGLLAQARFAVLTEPTLDIGPSDVAEALRRAVELDPKNPMRRARLAELLAGSGEEANARTEARIALELHENRYLDPLTQLPPDLVRILRSLLDDTP